jgi:penicillin-binding protein 2
MPPDTRYECTGAFELGRMRLRCWSHGHGSIAMREALEQSCNPYFCNLGVTLGLDPIRQMALRLGLGARTGIDIGGEREGLVPSDAWKRRVQGDAWRSGDTANISIGQGQLLVTPLQMAVCTAALANGGRVYRPRLVRDRASPEGDCLRTLDMGRALETVRGGMLDVIQAPRGTGKRAAVPGLRFAGKTGTAEYGTPANRRKHTWMIAFAPFDAPRVALAILVEDGESGGLTVAPIINQIMRHLFAPDLPDEGGSALPPSPEDAA